MLLLGARAEAQHAAFAAAAGGTSKPTTTTLAVLLLLRPVFCSVGTAGREGCKLAETGSCWSGHAPAGLLALSSVLLELLALPDLMQPVGGGLLVQGWCRAAGAAGLLVQVGGELLVQASLLHGPSHPCLRADWPFAGLIWAPRALSDETTTPAPPSLSLPLSPVSPPAL
eukprot:scaffold9914_cov17-Tisochrysis_lutea.AAC.4